MIAGYFVYVRNQFGGYDPEKRPHDMPHVGRPDPGVEACYAITAAEFALPLAELDERYPAPEPTTSAPNTGSNAFRRFGDCGCRPAM
jgi:hypothetical protein